MPPLHLLIKPASQNCQMRCKYCFYEDISSRRAQKSFGMMSGETLENVIRKALAHAEQRCTIAFQGGEPTLAGLDFFEQAAQLAQKHNTKSLTIHFALQTNGYAVDEAWAAFFARHRFLIGLSLDGDKAVNDLNRVDALGKSTFSRVMNAAKLFEKHGVEYNILTVITRQTARNIEKIYRFFIKNNFFYLQFIPCLDPLGRTRGREPYSLLPDQYARFLITLFDLWHKDITADRAVSVRYFDNLVHMLRGYPPESCGMMGVCSMQHVVEADGGVYPCDFYVTDGLCLGNLNSDSFDEINARREQLGFVTQSRTAEADCLACKWHPLCRGGCRRDRDCFDGSLGRNYYCETYRAFFEHAYPQLTRLAGIR